MCTKFRPDVPLVSLMSSVVTTCLHHHLKVFTVLFCLTVLANAIPHFLDSEMQPKEDEWLKTPDKRPARLSYFRTPHSSSRRRYESRGGGGGGGGGGHYRFASRRYGNYGSNDWWRNEAVKRPSRLSYFRTPYSSSWRRYKTWGGGRYSNGSSRRHEMPWDRLPNTNCLRESCRTDADCCRRFSKCNKRAHVCYDCWYGHPCRTDEDCCNQYPYCNRVLNTCGK